MGQELECTMRYRRRKLAGKASLETDHLLFRGPERLKIALKSLTQVKAADGVLRLDFDGGPAEFDLGKAAAKWAEKILHPPSRADKLGIQAGLAVRLEGEFDRTFVDELSARGVKSVANGAKADLLFYAANNATDLAIVSSLAKALQPAGALWMIYPKGVTEIREMQVLSAGREAGLKDIKVASFSATHTALKFVIPVAKR